MHAATWSTRRDTDHDSTARMLTIVTARMLTIVRVCFSRFRHQNAHTPLLRVGEGGRGEEGQRRISEQSEVLQLLGISAS